MARGTTLPQAPATERQMDYRAAAHRIGGELRAAKANVEAAHFDRSEVEMRFYLGDASQEAVGQVRERHALAIAEVERLGMAACALRMRVG